MTLSRLILILFTLLSVPLVAQDLGGLSKEKPFQLHGSLGLGSAYYNANGVPSRQQPLSWYLSGSPTLTIYGVSVLFDC
jgi:hypothetical protein